MEASTPDALRRPALSQADIRAIFVGIMLAMFLSALDQTIVATAMPTIGRDLGDAEHLPWIVTAYLLASTATTPLYGKFSDMHGRRVTMQIAIGVFVAGSIACALAPSMTALALARGLQGLGGGGLMSLAQTIVADMVSPRERGRYQAYFGTVFASASVLGPMLGGLFADLLHWSLIFWINLPLGLLAYWLVNARLKLLPRHDRRHRLDILGAALMTGATVTLMVALTSGGHRFGWGSPELLGLLTLSGLLWIGFGWRLASAPEPLIPLPVLADRVVAAGTLTSALVMGTYIGLAIILPIVFETRLGLPVRESGLALIPFMAGTVIGSTASGRAMAATARYKRLPTAGLALAVLGVGLLAALIGRIALLPLELILFAISVGLGTAMPITTVAIQNAVAPQHLGTATASMNFCRQLAGAIIVTVFGVIALGGQAGAALEARGTGAALVTDLTSIRWVFAAAAATLVIALVSFLLMEERPLRTRATESSKPTDKGS